MDLTGRTLWQVGAGDNERSYGDICCKFDVMLLGPGNPGRYSDENVADFADSRNEIRRFYTEAKREDIVLLRLGTGQILSVGEIADDEARWHQAFADVDGWDLQHVRRVRWFANTAQTFPARTLGSRVRSFAKVSVDRVREWVASLDVDDEQLTRPLTELPDGLPPLDRAELSRQLFIEGLPSERVNRLMQTFTSLDRVASWYANETKRPEGRPSEHETVAYLVMPLLFALGWSQQTAAIEWRHIDVALFEAMPTNDSTLTCVVEAKLLGSSVFSPLGQARDYALQPGREKCRRLIVTDGIRYTLHVKLGEHFELRAYLNILNMRERYPIFDCGGAVHAVVGMTP